MFSKKTISLLIGLHLLVPLGALAQGAEVKISKVDIGASWILVSFVVTNDSTENIYLVANSYLDRTSTAPTLPMRGALGACFQSGKWKPAPPAQHWDTPSLEHLTLQPTETLKGSYIMDRHEYPCLMPSRFKLQVQWYTHPPKPPKHSLRHPEKWKTASVEAEVKAQ